MGYTHYWTRTRNLTLEEMSDIAGSIRRIIVEATTMSVPYTDYRGYGGKPVDLTLPIVICGGDGTGKPTLTKYRISFNGEGPNLDHETFFFEPHRVPLYVGAGPDSLGSGFCKTARKPYDVVVVACLTFLSTDYGFRVSSDGDHEELQAGVDLCCKALGREYPHPLTVDIMLPTTVSNA